MSTAAVREVSIPVPVPDEAAAVFGARTSLAARYAQTLAGAGVERGLLGPSEAPVLWERHLLNCAVVAPLLRAGVRVGDIGSGAGLPGIVLALARPDVHVTCLEPLLRRSAFLTEVVEDLGLDNVAVVRVRAQDAPRAAFDVVTARAVAPLSRLIPMAVPLVALGGEILAFKGSRASAELAEVAPRLSRWGLGDGEVLSVGEEIVQTPATVVRLRLAGRGSAASSERQSS